MDIYCPDFVSKKGIYFCHSAVWGVLGLLAVQLQCFSLLRPRGLSSVLRGWTLLIVLFSTDLQSPPVCDNINTLLLHCLPGSLRFNKSTLCFFSLCDFCLSLSHTHYLSVFLSLIMWRTCVQTGRNGEPELFILHRQPVAWWKSVSILPLHDTKNSHLHPPIKTQLGLHVCDCVCAYLCAWARVVYIFCSCMCVCKCCESDGISL